MQPISRRSTTLARSTLKQVPRRSYATAPSSGADSSHLLSGLAGGSLVLLAGYGYYRYSGAHAAVQTAHSITSSAQAAKDKLLSSTPSAEEAIGLARSFTKTYVAAFPGAAPIVDSMFDKVEEAAKAHGEEVAEVVKSLYGDLKKAVEQGEKGGEKVVEAIKKAVEKVAKLAGEGGDKIWEKLGEKSPELKKALGGSGEELKKLSDKHGPEAQKIAEDAYNQASQLVTKGGLNAETYEKIKKLIQQKTDEISKLGKNVAGDAWDASGPLLEKMPDVKKMWEEKLGDLKDYVGEDNVKAAQEFSEGIEKIAKSGKSIAEQQKDAKKLFEDKVGSLGDLKKKAKDAGDKVTSAATAAAGGSFASVSKYLEEVPGFEELSKIVGGQDLQSLKELAEKHGDKAEKILQSTYEDLKKVLKEKAEEAKKVADEASKDVKKGGK